MEGNSLLRTRQLFPLLPKVLDLHYSPLQEHQVYLCGIGFLITAVGRPVRFRIVVGTGSRWEVRDMFG